MRNRRRYSRRGLSTVITSAMLVAAVSMMGTALLTWSNQSFANKQLAISNQTDSRINLIRENLVIEDVWFYQNATGTNFANVTVRNTGDIALVVSYVYINNTEAWNDGQVILADSIATIPVQTDWEAGKPQEVWVRTERGADIQQVWKS